MIKIIKPATQTLFQGKCSKCGCVIEFEESDFIRDDSRFSDYVECPTANCDTQIMRNSCWTMKVSP